MKGKQGKSEGFDSCDRPSNIKISNWIQFVDFSARVTLKYDGWPQKTIGHLFYTISSFVHHFKSICEVAQLGSKLMIFCLAWHWNFTEDLENNRAPLLYYIKLWASFQSHGWIQNGESQSRNAQFGSKSYFYPCDLEIWRMTLKNKRASLLSYIKRSAPLHCHMWNQTWVTVRKRLSGVMTSVTLTVDLWPWPFASTSRLSMVISLEDFLMTRREEHCQKRVKDGQTDGRVDRQRERETDRQTDRQRRKEVFLELLGRS